MGQSRRSSDHVPIWARIVTVLCAIVVIGGPLLWWFGFRREHQQWDEDIKFWDRYTLNTHRHSSNQSPHGLASLGLSARPDDPWEEFHFKTDDREYHWEGPYIPVAIQPEQKHRAYYLVVHDRASDDALRNPGYLFRFYRSRDDGAWDEIEPKDFPKHLAIQNMGLKRQNGPVNEFGVVKRLNPAEPEFRKSLTAALWVFLEDPTDTTGKNKEPSEETLKEYKKKWVRPPPKYRLDGAPWVEDPFSVNN